MARYRLRFLLQEIDLHEGETLVGRSADCHVTIEDPLVSRNHSRICIHDDCATIEDLDSRNGTFVNGRAVTQREELEDGDRVRIGTLELVFCHAADRAQQQAPGRRTTGIMCHCATCGLPYPVEIPSCPHCGSDYRVDDDTLSGVLGDVDRNWSLDMLVEVMSKAVAMQRWADVERMLKRARLNLDARLSDFHDVDRRHLDKVAQAAIELAAHQQNPEWAVWALDLHATLAAIPTETVLQPLDLMPEAVRNELAGPAKRLLAAVAEQPVEAPASVSLVRVRALRGS